MEQTCQKNAFRLRDRSNSPCSWLYVAMQKNLPICVRGWEDSTLANMYVGHFFQIIFVRFGIKSIAAGLHMKTKQVYATSFGICPASFGSNRPEILGCSQLNR
jgi:hypothetical protein